MKIICTEKEKEHLENMNCAADIVLGSVECGSSTYGHEICKKCWNDNVEFEIREEPKFMEKIKKLNKRLIEAKSTKRALESELVDIDYEIATIESDLKDELEKESDYESN